MTAGAPERDLPGEDREHFSAFGVTAGGYDSHAPGGYERAPGIEDNHPGSPRSS